MGMKVNGTSGLTFPDDTTLASAGQSSVRAWVNFNGTGTVAIRASYNVASITDNGVGNYTVNFSTAMPDADYAVSFCIGDNNVAPVPTSARQAANNITSFRYVSTYASSGTTGAFDYLVQMLAFFR